MTRGNRTNSRFQPKHHDVDYNYRADDNKTDRVRCVGACSHYITVTGWLNGRVRDEELINVDLDHMLQHHMRYYGYYYHKICTIQQKIIADQDAAYAKLQRKLEEAKKTAEQPSKYAPKPLAKDEIDRVDPRSETADICNALINVNGSIFKCTERCRYKSNVCIAHVGHPSVLCVPASQPN